MGFRSVLGMAQWLVSERAGAGDTVVDATAGGGVDTLFLARTVGSRGCVHAFDVQQEALDRTRARLDAEAEGALAPVKLWLAGHERMAELVPRERHGRVAAVMFNLGYLPGADRTVITRPDTTLAAMEAALDLLAPRGVLTAVLYPGHEGGGEEADAVAAWASALPATRAQTASYRFPQKPTAPYLIAIERKST